MKLAPALTLVSVALFAAVEACGSGTTPDCSDASVCEVVIEPGGGGDGSMPHNDSGTPEGGGPDASETGSPETGPAETGADGADTGGHEAGGDGSGGKKDSGGDAGGKEGGGKDSGKG